MSFDLVSALAEHGPFGLGMAGAVTWAIYESRKAERQAKEHAEAMAAEREKARLEREKHNEEQRRASADIIRLATEFAQARALNEQTDKLRQATMAEVVNALQIMGK